MAEWGVAGGPLVVCTLVRTNYKPCARVNLRIFMACLFRRSPIEGRANCALVLVIHGQNKNVRHVARVPWRDLIKLFEVQGHPRSGRTDVHTRILTLPCPLHSLHSRNARRQGTRKATARGQPLSCTHTSYVYYVVSICMRMNVSAAVPVARYI